MNPSQNDIVKNWESKEVKVSICCICYNQEQYISTALDSFINQKTKFAFEILIHDDASSDNTQAIIKEYEAAYPDIIKTICQTENQKSKFGSGINPRFNYPRASGNYIALCEGDDYWKDLDKLQKQYDFMEVNQDCSVCFTAALFENNSKPSKSFIKKPFNFQDGHKYSLNDSIYKAGDFMTTPTIFFRAEYFNQFPQWIYEAPVGDMPLSLYLGTVGYYGYLDFVGSVYRVNTSSSWSSKMTFEKRRRIVQGLLKLLDDFNTYTQSKYQEEVEKEKKRILFNDRKSVVKRAIATSFLGRAINRILDRKNNYH